MSTNSIPANMPESVEKPKRHWSWKKIGGGVLLLSIAIHLLFGAGAAVWIVQEIQSARKLTFQGASKAPAASTRALEHKVQVPKKQSSMSAPAQAKRIATTGLSKIVLPDMPAMSTANTLTPNAMSGAGGLQGFGGLGAMGTGSGSGNGGSGISFFGLRGRTKSIVFVTDISGSMVIGRKSPETYSLLEKEVAKAINGLDDQTKINLVVFAKSAESYRKNSVTATTSEKNKAISWLRRTSPVHALESDPDPKIAFRKYLDGKHGGTSADLGLAMAFEMKPDTIIFVSDGEPTRPARTILAQVAELQKQLPKPIVINVVAYMADDGQAFMKRLAEENGGTFKEVSGKTSP